MTVPAIGDSLHRVLAEARACIIAELPTALAAINATDSADMGWSLPEPAVVSLRDTAPDRGWASPYIGIYADTGEVEEADALGAYDVTWAVSASLLMSDRSVHVAGPTTWQVADYQQAVRAYAWAIAQVLGAHLATSAYGRPYGVWLCTPRDVRAEPMAETLDRGALLQPHTVRVDVHQRVRQLAVSGALLGP